MTGERLRKLSASEALMMVQLAKELEEELLLEDFDRKLCGLLCEYAAFCYLAVEIGGGRKFLSPRAVLEECSLEELAAYYEAYEALYLSEGGDEFAV